MIARKLWALLALAGPATLMFTGTALAQAAPDNPGQGRVLYDNSCASCHGTGGAGSPLGPPLTGSGAAGADFMLTTGRMPLDDPHSQPVRKPPAFDKAQIDQITAYVASMGSGPPIPTLALNRADLVKGRELYSLNCAACHSAAGAGGAVGAGLEAPRLDSATPLQIVEAMRIGPGAMPVFGEQNLSEQDAGSIARYLVYLRAAPDPGGLAMGRIGPIAEGFVAWMIGVGLLIGACRWIGEKR